MRRIFILCILLFFSTQTFARSEIAKRTRRPVREKIETPQKIKERVFTTLPLIHGWCSVEKANALMDLIFASKPNTIVEIGVFGGSSIFPMASALKHNNKGEIIGIDPWENSECTKFADPESKDVNRDWWSEIDLEAIYQTYIGMLKKYDIDSFVTTLRTTSEKAAAAIQSIDLLHIDGNHYEESSLGDVKRYFPKVKKGGYIIMDDTGWKSTEKAVTFLMESCEHIQTIDDGNCMIFRK